MPLRVLARRIIQAVLTLLVVTVLMHGAVALLPGDPIRALFGFRRPNPEVYAQLQELYNLDEPWIVQYVTYIRHLLTGNWGYSLPGLAGSRGTVGAPVAEILRQAVPISLRLLIPVIAVQLVAGVTAGATSVQGKKRWSRTGLYAGSVVVIGFPVIVIAYALQIIAEKLGFSRQIGIDGWSGYILPVASLALTSTALVVLLTRSQLQDALVQPFIVAARARSIPAKRVLRLHALRLALPSVFTFIAANFGQLLTGLIIVEAIFDIPGVGSVLFEAIQDRDQALLIAMVVFTTAVALILNLIADVLHFLLDPRIREET